MSRKQAKSSSPTHSPKSHGKKPPPCINAASYHLFSKKNGFWLKQHYLSGKHFTWNHLPPTTWVPKANAISSHLLFFILLPQLHAAHAHNYAFPQIIENVTRSNIETSNIKTVTIVSSSSVLHTQNLNTSSVHQRSSQSYYQVLPLQRYRRSPWKNKKSA